MVMVCWLILVCLLVVFWLTCCFVVAWLWLLVAWLFGGGCLVVYVLGARFMCACLVVAAGGGWFVVDCCFCRLVVVCLLLVWQVLVFGVCLCIGLIVAYVALVGWLFW